jgi:hypothetical protein
MIKELSISVQKAFLLESKPVVILTGNEFTKKEGITLTQQVSEYYKSIGGIVILPLDNHKQGEKTLSAMLAAPLIIGTDRYIGVVVIRQYASGNKKLYVHEVFLTRKLLDGSSNPAHIPATHQGVMLESPADSFNPTLSLATNQGSIAKILQKILSAKSE